MKDEKNSKSKIKEILTRQNINKQKIVRTALIRGVLILLIFVVIFILIRYGSIMSQNNGNDLRIPNQLEVIK